MNEISENLRLLLQKRQMTMEELSSRSNIAIETIRNLVYRKAHNPRLLTVLSICKALHVPVEALVDAVSASSEDSLMDDYRCCSSHGKHLIRCIASLEAQLTSISSSSCSQKEIPCICPPPGVSDNSPYLIYDVQKICTGCPDAFLAIRMPSNEFAPCYCTNDILLLSDRFPQEHEHALFIYQGRILFRKFQSCSRGYMLYPVTGHTHPLFLEHLNFCRIIGTCIGIERT